MIRAKRWRGGEPGGAAAVELALTLPILCFIGLATADFGRVIPASIAVADCARHGALYAADPNLSTSYANVAAAALAGAGNLSPTPAVATASGTDANGYQYVEVTVTYTFQTVAGYPGIPAEVPLSSTVRMPKAPG
jgi:Flp pilus assembly protein TadG